MNDLLNILTAAAVTVAAEPANAARSSADIAMWLQLAVSVGGFVFIVLVVMALFGHGGETAINAQRRMAIARGLGDRSTPFEWPVTAAVMWVLWRLATRLSLVGFKSRLNRTLVAAGSPGFYTGDEYIALSVFIASLATMVITGADFLLRGESSLITAAIIFVMALLLAMYYPFDLAKKRARKISRQVPYTLDLISLAMGAGGSFTEAIETITAEDPEDPEEPFNVELRTVLAEMDLGATRIRALENMARRIRLDSLKSIIASIVQAEKLGTPLVDILSSQAELLRRRRSVSAEKQAALASVRILLPSMVILLSVVLTIFAPLIIRAASGGLFQ